MTLPRELWDDMVPEATTVVGDLGLFIFHLEHGYVWREWCSRVRNFERNMWEHYWGVSPEVIEELLRKP